MVAFLDLMAQRTLEFLKDQLIGINKANGNPVTAWKPGDPSERWLDLTPRFVYAVLSGITTQAVRGFFLDLATDPGDAGDLSADQTPRAGFLSALGEGWFGTVRRGQTYATTTLVITNTGTGASLAFSAYDLSFTTQGDPPKADGGRPTYRNTSGTAVGIAPGASVTISVIAEQPGAYGNASPGALTLVTHSFDGSGSLSVTSSGGPIGEDRESPESYRARCRLAAAKLSPGGPGAAYKYAATTNRDGTPLLRADGAPVGITKTFVSADSTTGIVNAYFADDDGGADSGDVDAANANIQGIVATNIPDPLGVVPDCVTYAGAAATNTNFTIVGTAKIKSVPGTSDTALKAAAEAAINSMTAGDLGAMARYFAASPIGGEDQVAGVGVIATSDFVGVIYSAYPGLYAPAITSPATSTTAIALGHVAHLVSCNVVVTVVP